MRSKIKKIKFCKLCVISNLKPNITFSKLGICSACQNSETKKIIQNSKNYNLLKRKFSRFILAKKNKKYDVIIPVSGGKDSLFQVCKTKEITKKILAVCVDFGLRTDVGEKNLSLIPNKLNVDLIKFSFNKETIRKLALYGLVHHGDPDLFNHILLYNLPILLAKDFGIKTVIFGEDPRVNYSNYKLKKNTNINSLVLDKNYFNNFVNHSRINTKNILNKLNIPENEKKYFIYKKHFTVKVIFLGNYFEWDSNKNFKISKSLGFLTSKITEGTYRNFVNVDEDWNRIHHYLKLLKFGYGRATDHACEDIRLGNLKRSKAIKLVKKFDFEPLSNYYKKRICEYLEISSSELNKNLEKYRNKKIWKKKGNNWKLKFNF
tara:strand:- start:6894 stop:8021 length:1128 start_codon:yes stop_codon:yes gene_type:complete